MDRPNRIALPRQGTCSDAPSQFRRPSVMISGVRLSETRVATRSPGLSPSGGVRAGLLDDAGEHAA